MPQALNLRAVSSNLKSKVELWRQIRKLSILYKVANYGRLACGFLLSQRSARMDDASRGIALIRAVSGFPHAFVFAVVIDAFEISILYSHAWHKCTKPSCLHYMSSWLGLVITLRYATVAFPIFYLVYRSIGSLGIIDRDEPYARAKGIHVDNPIEVAFVLSSFGWIGSSS